VQQGLWEESAGLPRAGHSRSQPAPAAPPQGTAEPLSQDGGAGGGTGLGKGQRRPRQSRRKPRREQQQRQPEAGGGGGGAPGLEQGSSAALEILKWLEMYSSPES